MSKPTFCCTCVQWEKDIFTRIGEKFGICHHVIVETKVIQDRETKINEDNTLFTESYFGCVYWREGNYVLIDLNKEIKEQEEKEEEDQQDGDVLENV